MQWDVIIDDLLAQLDQAQRSEVRGLAEELAQAELAQTAVLDRLRAQGVAPVGCTLMGGLRLAGTCSAVGADWLLLDAGPVQALIPLAAVVTLSGLGPRAQDPASAVAARLTMASAIRGLASRRVAVVIQLTAGTTLEGMISRVGADHLDVVRRDDAPGGSPVTVLFPAIAAVTSRQGGP